MKQLGVLSCRFISKYKIKKDSSNILRLCARKLLCTYLYEPSSIDRTADFERVSLWKIINLRGG